MDDFRLDADASPDAAASPYVVVARRYRPQAFAELVGQQHVAQALAGAINSGRVGHAYLFTGARGVGKTSAARILAKALNCVNGPTPTPCNECDICLSVSSGDDVDVLEIDGASNRGIDEIRELRQKANVLPSRARFKIYIIDEVHMLTREAFNALLKTLEEPPEHVKFIFCTTEPDKIPITILSRCQRFDFAGIQSPAIVERLRQIVAAEGVEAEQAALELLARRAAGSMRDSQSLLEQLLAFGQSPLQAADVHKMLGTAGEDRLAGLVDRIAERDAAGALAALDLALGEGVEVGQLLDQLIGYFRDVMVASVGAPSQAFLYSSPSEGAQINEVARTLGLETILAAMQILESAAARLKYSAQGRIIVELALVRVCRLENLEELATLLDQARSGQAPMPAAAGQRAAPVSRPAPAAAHRATAPTGQSSAASDALKKNGHPEEAPVSEPRAASTPSDSTSSESSPPAPVALSEANVGDIWQAAVAQLPPLAATHARNAQRVAASAPDQLAVTFAANYNSSKSLFERPEQINKLLAALRDAAGRDIRVTFHLEAASPATTAAAMPTAAPVSRRQRLQEVSRQPLVQQAMELFDARPIDIEEPGA